MGLYNPHKTRKTQSLWVCVILIGLEKAEDLCKPIWNRRVH